ncbi:hypothetical protein [uncultured Dokdonia sp.]|uniref:hypothetical protein n=1 Tax=uncultured Dokdonia sp. TaxID=575653 RepID=UPI00261364FA|nr:hypothetical protein [uncultured Dokdonia sp.]
MCHFDWSEIRPEIKDTVLYIEKRNSIDTQYTGYSGSSSSLWKTQQWLINNAKKSELHQLMNYKNSAVKGVIFEGLLERKDSKVFDYIINSVDDEGTIHFQLGCVGNDFGLTEYYLFLVRSTTRKELTLKVRDYLFSEDQIKILDSIVKTKTRYLIN